MKYFMCMDFILLLAIQLITTNACKTHTQVVEGMKPVAELPAILTECSGMLELAPGKFLGLNDSGNKPHLYVFGTQSKDVRVIRVLNVSNHDWEELAEDEKFIYVGDFGNNGGTRQNLMIYKIPKADLLDKDEVTPQIISFRYAGQTKFNDSNRHNFDCEAMISKGDSLYLFSKNRGDFRTDLYALPKTPGEYVTKIQGSFDSEGLVTGADYKEYGGIGELVLVGYSVHGKALYPFILHFPEVNGSDLLGGKVMKQSFSQALQTETVIFHDANAVYLTNEEEDDSAGFIYEVKLKTFSHN